MRSLTLKQVNRFSINISSKRKKWNSFSAFLVRGTRHGRIVFDADWTFLYLKRALLFVSQLVKDRHAVVLFVFGTSKFFVSMNNYALRCSQPYYSGAYVGGSLTNFFMVKRRVTSLSSMTFLPSVLLVFNPQSYAPLIIEAIKLSIPVISVFSANMNLKLITYPVPCNFSQISISFVAHLFSKSIIASRLFEAKFLFPVDSYVFKMSRWEKRRYFKKMNSLSNKKRMIARLSTRSVFYPKSQRKFFTRVQLFTSNVLRRMRNRCKKNRKKFIKKIFRIKK